MLNFFFPDFLNFPDVNYYAVLHRLTSVALANNNRSGEGNVRAREGQRVRDTTANLSTTEGKREREKHSAA